MLYLICIRLEDESGGQGMRREMGFNLIELMVVISILALLMGIVLPAYRNYIAKTQIIGALAEIRAGKTTIDYVHQENRDAVLVDASYVGLSVSRRCTAVEAELDSAGVATISCTLAGNSKVNGLVLSLHRAEDGVWTCDASAFEQELRPAGC